MPLSHIVLFMPSRERFNNPPGSTATRELRADRRARRARRMRLRKLRGWH